MGFVKKISHFNCDSPSLETQQNLILYSLLIPSNSKLCFKARRKVPGMKNHLYKVIITNSKEREIVEMWIDQGKMVEWRWICFMFALWRKEEEEEKLLCATYKVLFYSFLFIKFHFITTMKYILNFVLGYQFSYEFFDALYFYYFFLFSVFLILPWSRFLCVKNRGPDPICLTH